jgi:hypothetical protein
MNVSAQNIRDGGSVWVELSWQRDVLFLSKRQRAGCALYGWNIGLFEMVGEEIA